MRWPGSAARHLDQAGRRQADEAALAQAVEQGAVFQARRGGGRHPVFARRQRGAARCAVHREGGHQRGHQRGRRRAARRLLVLQHQFAGSRTGRAGAPHHVHCAGIASY